MPYYTIWAKVPIPYKRMTQRSKYLPSNQAYLACKNDLAIHLKESSAKGLKYLGPVSVMVTVIRPKKTGDVDNYLKLVLDALQESGIIKNDNQVIAASAAIIDPKELGRETAINLLQMRYTQGEDNVSHILARFVDLDAGLLVHVMPWPNFSL